MLLPGKRLAVFFRVLVPWGDLIDSFEVEAAAVADATFASIKTAGDVRDEVTFVDNTVSRPWTTSGCSHRPAVDAILAGLWLNLTVGRGFKWWERVSSRSNLAPGRLVRSSRTGSSKTSPNSRLVALPLGGGESLCPGTVSSGSSTWHACSGATQKCTFRI